MLSSSIEFCSDIRDLFRKIMMMGMMYEYVTGFGLIFIVSLLTFKWEDLMLILELIRRNKEGEEVGEEMSL